MKEWALTDNISKIMDTCQELQQTRTLIVEASEGSFENQANRLVIYLIDASYEYAMSFFKFLRSVGAGYVYYVAYLNLDPRYANLTGSTRLAESNGMEDVSVIVQWYKKGCKMAGSCVRCTIGSNVENKSNPHDDSFDIFGSTLNVREEQIVAARAENSRYQKLTILDEEVPYVMVWLNNQEVVCPNVVSVARCTPCNPESQDEKERLFPTAGILSKQGRRRMYVEWLGEVVNILANSPDRSNLRTSLSWMKLRKMI